MRGIITTILTIVIVVTFADHPAAAQDKTPGRKDPLESTGRQENESKARANQQPAQQQGPGKPVEKPQDGKQDLDKSRTDSDPKPEESPTSSSTSRNTASNSFANYLSAPRRQRLGRQPRMFGDWFRNGIQVVANSEVAFSNGLFTNIELAGGGRVSKIAENNSALPFDRTFINYSHFHNAFGGSAVGPNSQTGIRSPSVDRWTVGLEKTFFDGLTSIETRFVMSQVDDFGHNPVGVGPSGVQSYSPTAGNLALVGKVLLFENASTALAAGTGIELPTGGDSFFQSGTSKIEIENQAIYISPYIGLLKKPTDSPWFANLFMQLEVATGGDGVAGVDLVTGNRVAFGKINQPTQLYFDIGIGRWIYQQPGNFVSGIAGFLEAHYNASLSDIDSTAGLVSAGGYDSLYLLNPNGGRTEVLDLTFGLHFEIADQTKMRIGGVFPVTNEKSFDGEFGFQISRNFR